jgi:hypothetical protein
MAEILLRILPRCNVPGQVEREKQDIGHPADNGGSKGAFSEPAR